MNNRNLLAIGAGAAVAAVGVAVIAWSQPSGLLGPTDCGTSVCTISVGVTRKLPILRCSVSVAGQANVTDDVKTIVWKISSTDYMFKSSNGVKILNNATDFKLLASAAGQEFKLEFLGQGNKRTYDYELNIVSAGDGESCFAPGPTLPRIKNN